MIKRKRKLLYQPLLGAGMQSILFLLFCIWSSTSYSVTLIGEVVGLDESIKRNVSISIFGIENRRTQTDKDGKFTVDLPPGSYLIRIRQNPNRQEIPYEIEEDDADKEETFKVNW